MTVARGCRCASHRRGFPTLANDAWYRVEVVIFERIADVDPASTQEIFVTHAPRAFPRDVIAFDDDANRSAAYVLDAESRAQPALPVSTAAVTYRAQPQPRCKPCRRTPTAAERAASGCRLRGAAAARSYKLRTISQVFF